MPVAGKIDEVMAAGAAAGRGHLIVAGGAVEILVDSDRLVMQLLYVPAGTMAGLAAGIGLQAGVAAGAVKILRRHHGFVMQCLVGPAGMAVLATDSRLHGRVAAGAVAAGGCCRCMVGSLLAPYRMTGLAARDVVGLSVTGSTGAVLSFYQSMVVLAYSALMAGLTAVVRRHGAVARITGNAIGGDIVVTGLNFALMTGQAVAQILNTGMALGAVAVLGRGRFMMIVLQTEAVAGAAVAGGGDALVAVSAVALFEPDGLVMTIRDIRPVAF